MASKFTPSINIIRDTTRSIRYIPTPNAVKIISQIEQDFSSGIRAFNLIGSYGTGKSSFLLAFEQSLIGTAKHFELGVLPADSVSIINVVGEFDSLQRVLADKLELTSAGNLSQNIFSEIYNRYHVLGPKNPLLLIVIDEFGKFLEFAAHNEPEKELYFIQQLAEFVHREGSNIVLITSVHQNFDAYSHSLTLAQKQEWSKVKGRFKEIAFNEPVEQLLFLAAEHMPVMPGAIARAASILKINHLFTEVKAFNISSGYFDEIARKLFPLEPFSASILTLALQRYGQNERSLFSFLNAAEHNRQSEETIDFYGIDQVYDYLIFNFFSFLNSKYNPDFSVWKSIQSALERVEAFFDHDISSEAKIIKTIGLLSLFSSSGGKLDQKFMSHYAESSLGILDATSVIKELEEKKILLYRNYSCRYVLFEGTDLDFQSALIAAGNKVSDITDIPTLLRKYYQLPLIFAKEVSYLTGTPRLFEYVISELPINKIPVGEIDGFINLIFNEKLSLNEILSVSANQKEAILYCYYKKSSSIKDLLLEIEKTNQVIEDNIDDKIAVRELNHSIDHQKRFLTHKILNNFYTVTPEVIWVYRGHQVKIPNRKSFNKQLSFICMYVYCMTPIFNNELVNKHKISSSIHTAKKNYYRALVTNWNKYQLGFPDSKFPPEKTIYLSLLETNGIDTTMGGERSSKPPLSHNKFDILWAVSTEFLESSKISKKRLSDFVELLSSRPYKLKRGLIDFWVPTFLFIKRDEFALFSNAVFIPFLNEEVLELIAKNPSEYELKVFDIRGIKLDIFNSYRTFLNKNQENEVTTTKFIDTIKPFLSFYRELPTYTRTTQRLDKRALLIRDAIASSTDPEITFFEDFPKALGYNLQKAETSDSQLQEYALALQSVIKSLRTCYTELVDRVEAYIQEEIIGQVIPFEDIKRSLQHRFKELRRHLLISRQKVFIQRLDSKLEDRNAWLNSLVQALIGKPLDKIQDEEEVLIYNQLREMIVSLDTLTKISTSEFKEEKELVFDLQISSFADGVSRKLIRMPKVKQKKVLEIENMIKGNLSKDVFLNIAALTNLLKEMIK